MAKASSKKSPELHSYQKVITRPGTYRVPAKKTDPNAAQDASGRWYKEETFSINRLKDIATLAAEMSAEGIKIPAPFAHRDKNKNTIFPTKAGSDGASLDALTDKPLAWDASINGGFWRDLQLVDDVSKINSEFKPGPGLIGTVDTFGEPSDLNSPAGKVSRTVQETSICLIKDYKPAMSDKAYPDYIAHIAMPVHAIEQGQDNFAEVAAMSEESDDDLCIVQMSDLVTTNADPTNQPAQQDDPEMIEVLDFLKQLKIDLPPETNRDSLVSILRIVLRQKIADQHDMTSDDSLTQAPAGSSSKPAPVAMSTESATVNALLLRETNRLKENLRSRLQRLQSRGFHELKPEVVTELTNEINLVQMSADNLNADDGSFPTSLIESKIVLLEKTGRPMTGSLVEDESLFSMSAPAGSYVPEEPKYGEEEIPAEYAQGIVDRALV